MFFSENILLSVLILSVTSQDTASVNFTNLQFKNYVSFEKRLEKHTGCIDTLNKCVNLCTHHLLCESLFFRIDTNHCQLHSGIFSNETELVPSFGWEYYIIGRTGITDCYELLYFDWRQNGVFKMKKNQSIVFDNVYCDMDTDGGGWTVFQRRLDGSVDFFRGWDDYKIGFGDIHGEFWLGNELLHTLTSKHSYMLRIDMEDYDGIWKYAEYSSFIISSESTGYSMNIGGYTGDAGDSLTSHGGRRFYTKDKDAVHNCANSYAGAWWYSSCHSSNLNGLYSVTAYGRGINWYSWHGYYYSMRKTEMKMKRIN